MFPRSSGARMVAMRRTLLLSSSPRGGVQRKGLLVPLRRPQSPVLGAFSGAASLTMARLLSVGRKEEGGGKTILDFEDCRSYLLHRLHGGKELDGEGWDSLLEEITETLPAREMNAFSEEDEEGSPRRKKIRARHKSLVGRGVLRRHTRTLFVLGVCAENSWTKTAMSLVEHLVASEEGMTVAQKELALNLLATRTEGVAVDGRMEERVLQFCQVVQDELKEASSTSGLHLGWWLMAALAKTSRWKEALAMRPPEGSDQANAAAASENAAASAHVAMANLARRAIAEEDEDGRLWEALTDSRFHQSRRAIREATTETTDQIAATWIDRCCSRKKEERTAAQEGLDQLFNYLGGVGYFVTPHLEERLRREAETAEPLFTLQPASIRRSGFCEVSEGTLPSSELSESEFDRLREAVKERLLVSSDLYKTTTAEEFSRFRSYLEAPSQKYDVVVDGLNVALGTEIYIKSNAERGERLLEVVSTLIKRDMTPLVIARAHARKFKNFGELEHLCKLMLFQNVSEDDPFLIAAALQAGRNAKFVSNDGLRQHIFNLKDPELRDLFSRWQAGAQIRHTIIHKGKWRVKAYLAWPPRHVLNCCWSSGAWHLPLVNEEVEDKTTFMIPPKEWLCLHFR